MRKTGGRQAAAGIIFYIAFDRSSWPVNISLTEIVAATNRERLPSFEANLS